MIDPFERIEVLVNVHGIDALKRRMDNYTVQRGDAELEFNGTVLSALVAGTATAILDRLRETIGDDVETQRLVLGHIAIALFHAEAALLEAPPGMVATMTAMAAPPSAMEVPVTVDGLADEAEQTAAQVAVKLSEEVVG